MSTSENVTSNLTDDVDTQQLTAKEQKARRARKKRAEARRKRVLAGGGARLDYVQNRVSADKLLKTEKENLSKPNNTVIAPPKPQVEPGPIPGFPFDMGSQQSLFNNPQFGQMFNTAMPTDPNVEARSKQLEIVQQRYAKLHICFCALFAVVLVFVADDYDITIFRYNISSDAWTFFVAFELLMFSLHCAQKYYDEQTYAAKNPNAGGGLGDLTQMLAGMGISAQLSMLGIGNGNPQMSSAIQKWINRGTMIWNYAKMLKQFLSDLCLVLFLWIVMAAIKTILS